MKRFMQKIKRLMGIRETRNVQEFPDLDLLADKVAATEQESDIETGRRIHEAHYRDLTLYLDLDITESYRVTVFRGNNKIYSFSIYCDIGEYKRLKEGYRRIFRFLEGDRNLRDLPDNERIKGYYFGE